MAEEVNARQYDLVLLGATGYTGKFAAEWVTTRLPEDLTWAVAGRNAKKLQNVVNDLKELNPGRKQPDIEICELQHPDIDTLVQKTKLIITTVGPFMFYGEPVLAACANHGTHYLDCTGEAPWIYDMISRYHETAKRNKAIIIPQCGLDSVPADITAYVLARQIRKRFNVPCERVILSMYDAKTGISGGTSLTMLELFNNYPLSHLAKTMHPYSLSPIRATTAVRSPKGTETLPRILGLLSIPELGGLQTTGLMAATDTCIVHRSWGLYAQSANDSPSSSPSMSYGPNFRFNEYMRAKTLLHGIIVKLTIASLGALFAFPPTRWLLTPLFKNFVLTPPGQGPSRASMKDDFMSYRALGVAENSKGNVTARLDIAYGGYVATGMTLCAAAKVILRGRLEDTQAGRLGGGILTPALLGEELVGVLDEFGMSIRVDE